MRLKLLNKSSIISLILGSVCALGNNPWALWYLSIVSLILWFWHINSNDLKSTSNTSIKLPMGRGEILRLKKGKILIDYAHDYQSMKNILSELHNYYSALIIIFGLKTQ